jgi:hypothetical protein
MPARLDVLDHTNLLRQKLAKNQKLAKTKVRIVIYGRQERPGKTYHKQFCAEKGTKSPILTDASGKPPGDKVGNLRTVFLEHQHVTVTVDAGFAKLNPR